MSNRPLIRTSRLELDIHTPLHFESGWFHLPDPCNLNELAAYPTGSGAALVTIIVTAFNNKRKEW